MIPAQCDFHRAETVEGAIDRLAEFADRDAALVAGGHGLVPDMKTGEVAPDVLIDVSDVEEMAGIEVDDGAVSIGALAAHADVAESERVRAASGALADAAAKLGDLQVRTRGTLGGNLAEADPAADPPAAVLAADATLNVVGPDGERSVSATEFFAGDGETALGHAEVLTRVRIPDDGSAGAYVRKTHPASGYATVGVAVELLVEDGAISSARAAVTGALDRAIRLPSVEEALTDRAVDEIDPGRATESAADGLAAERFREDPHATAAYRQRLVSAYAERALTSALERAGGDA